jgi:hypothetical protein
MNNLQRLGNTLNGRMAKVSGAAVPTTIELGTINSNLSLSTDSLKSPIPKGDYMIDVRLASSTYNTSSTTHSHSSGEHGGHTSGTGSHSHSGGAHTHRLPNDFRPLKSGDRVLVAWCGNEPVVIAIVVSS